MKKLAWCSSVILAFIFLLTACVKRVEQNFRTPVGEQIWYRIQAPHLRAGGDSIYARTALTDFYKRRNYREGWSVRRAENLVKALSRADLEGLRPEDYHLAAIENMLSGVRSDIQKASEAVPTRLAEFDILLTDAFLVYGSHLLSGRVNPESIQTKWVPNQQQIDLARVLESALESGNISGTLATLTPAQPGFRRLCRALSNYRELASQGGWPTIPDGPALKRGDHESRVATLRERLSFDGSLASSQGGSSQLFDEELEQALKRFQRCHGLGVSGTLDSATRAELNVSVERRVEQLEMNLERWRWLPHDLGQNYVLVNIPAFQLNIMEDEASILDMRIVVGTLADPTPVLNANLEYLFINPYWNVPSDMLIREMLPQIKRDPSYLSRKNLRVFKGWEPDAPEVDPKTVNWSSISSDDCPYRLRQDPGPLNGMGRVKFIFPNKFNVYLHDTPGRHLFDQAQRTFSHGCIRIAKPIDLAVYLLRQDPHWSRDTLLRELGKNVPRSVLLPKKIPIYLVYRTAWAEGDNTIHFRPDIYGWDKSLLLAMRTSSTNQKKDRAQNVDVQGG